MAEGDTGRDNSVTGGKKWPGYCKTFLVKEPNGSIKELVFPKALDLDRPKRERTTFSNRQLQQLEDEFKSNQYIVGKDRTKLAKSLGLSETQVKVWFQNRRTKLKKDNERKESFNDPQAESKAAQNVLKLLAYNDAGGGFFPTFHGKQLQVADLAAVSSTLETDSPQETPPASKSQERLHVSPSGTHPDQAYLQHKDFNDSSVGTVRLPGVPVHASFPIKIPNPFAESAINPAQAACHSSFQENSSPARRSNESRDQEVGHFTGHHREVPIHQTTFESNSSTDTPNSIDQYLERSAYFGQQEAALTSYANLPPWFGNYQRLNFLNSTGAHWLQNNHHASRFGSQQSLHSLPPTASLVQQKNIFADLPHPEHIRQQVSNPEGFIWGYVQPPHGKRFNLPDHFSY